jgi:hypothetical protein
LSVPCDRLSAIRICVSAANTASFPPPHFGAPDWGQAWTALDAAPIRRCAELGITQVTVALELVLFPALSYGGSARRGIVIGLALAASERVKAEPRVFSRSTGTFPRGCRISGTFSRAQGGCGHLRGSRLPQDVYHASGRWDDIDCWTQRSFFSRRECRADLAALRWCEDA